MACRVDGFLAAVASMAFGWGRGSARRTSHRFGRPRRRDGARRIFTSSWASRASEPRRQRPQYLKDSHRSAHRASPVATGFLRSCVLLCLEVGCLATRPARGLRDRTPAPPPALVRRRPECYLGGDDDDEGDHRLCIQLPTSQRSFGLKVSSRVGIPRALAAVRH